MSRHVSCASSLQPKKTISRVVTSKNVKVCDEKELLPKTLDGLNKKCNLKFTQVKEDIGVANSEIENLKAHLLLPNAK